LWYSDELKAAAGQNGVKKREAVYDKGENVKTSASYVPKVIEKSKNIKDLLTGVVTTNILFSSYARDEHAAIVDAFECKEVTNKTFVIKQGESGEHFYVVQSGTLEIFVKAKSGEETKVGSTLGPGSCFGELALMYNTPRAASIQAASDCVLWEIDRTTYRGILVYYKYLRNKQYMEFLRNVEIMEKKLGAIMSESKLLCYVMLIEDDTYLFLFSVAPNQPCSFVSQASSRR
jgi:signal-transduction protein with cAMP-binding, CBS, and nucleotidyltransferase domain